jgi:hypothetical protein
MHSRVGCHTLGAPIQTIRKDSAVFMFFFLRFKYGPLIIVLAGVALMAIGAGVTHHLATGIVGAVLVVMGAAVGVRRKRRGIPVGDPDDAPQEISRSTDSADHPHGRADAEADPTNRWAAFARWCFRRRKQLPRRRRLVRVER